MKSPISVVAVVLLPFAIGCGGRSSESSVSEKPTRVVKVEKPPSESDSKAIHRNDLKSALAAGPAALLAKVRTEAILNNGNFVGFKIVGFTKGEPTVPELRVGDVVISVNGRRVERPEDYFEIFQKLGNAKELSFNILRGGVPQSLKYTIID